MSNSIMQSELECYVCYTRRNLQKHHIFYGTARRKLSEEDGCWCWLCATHHTTNPLGVHFNKKLDLKLKQMCENRWIEKNNKTENEFIRRYGKTWLKEE